MLGRPRSPAPSDSRTGDESALLRSARSGSRDAAETLARRYWDDAFRTAYLILRDAGAAEDVTQEALVAALTSLGRFDLRRRFAPWLHRIVVHRALDRLRATGRRREVDLAAAEGRKSASELAALPGDVVAALGVLDPQDRAIVILRHLFDYRAREIGQMVGLRASSVRTRLQRALLRLREDLTEERR